jgi:hypothetical protein
MRALWARPDETPMQRMNPYIFFKNLVDSDDLELISVKMGILGVDKSSFITHCIQSIKKSSSTVDCRW